MRRFVHGLALLGLALAVLPALAARSADEAAERARLAAERREVEARHAAGERDCAQRFAVNDCLDAVRAARRDALAGLAQRQAALDDAERRRRAEARQRRIEAKQARRASAPAPAEPLLPMEVRRARPKPAPPTQEAAGPAADAASPSVRRP